MSAIFVVLSALGLQNAYSVTVVDQPEQAEIFRLEIGKAFNLVAGEDKICTPGRD